MDLLLILPSIICFAAGIALLILSFKDHLHEADWFGRKPDEKELRKLHIAVITIMAAAELLTLVIAWTGDRSLDLLTFVDGLTISFHIDNISRIFVTVTALVWFLACLYATEYMSHEGNEKRFFGFYLIVYGVLVLIDFSGNLVTFYFFYEMMTLTSMAMVLHNGTREAIMASLKYMFYSMAGAYCALFGIYLLYQNCSSLDFTEGGTLTANALVSHPTMILSGVLLMMIGFGAKAGMMPLHSWLPAAHPVAPTPASAVLSSIIVKAGVLGAVRTIYYIVGPDYIRGTWMQAAWIILSLGTVFMGSLLAFREKVFKKRLAYSTVSQVSYIMFGLAVLDETALTGALLHVIVHAFVKCALFASAGILIYRTGMTNVTDYKGVGKKMPVTMWCYTIASLTLIGIPPTGGFISKWYLALGSLGGNIGVLGYVGPAVLLASALLTAGYLLPISLDAFLPGSKDETPRQRERIDAMSILPLILVTCAVLIGLFPNPVLEFIEQTISGLL